MISPFLPALLAAVIPNPQDPAGTPSAESHALDRSQWVLRLREVDSEPARAIYDIVFFHDGRLRSRHFSRRGFPPASYRAWIDGDVTRFEARAATAVGAAIEWIGSVSEDSLSGTVGTTDQSVELIKLAFRGQRSPVLEGTRWLATLTPPPRDGEPDPPAVGVRLAFWNGMATTTLQSGGMAYRPATYALLPHDDEWALEFRQEGIEGGTRHWSATMDGDRLDGSVQANRPNGEVDVYDLSAVRFPAIDGRWDLDLTSTGEGSRQKVTLAIEGTSVQASPVFGEVLEPGVLELNWLEGKWRLLAEQGKGSKTRRWEATLDGGLLRGRVVQRIGSSEIGATFTGVRVADR